MCFCEKKKERKKKKKKKREKEPSHDHVKIIHGRVVFKGLKHERAINLKRFYLWNTTSHGRVVIRHSSVFSEFFFFFKKKP